MEMKIDTEELCKCVDEIQKCQNKITLVMESMERCKFPTDNVGFFMLNISASFKPAKEKIINDLLLLGESLKHNEGKIIEKIEMFEKAGKYPPPIKPPPIIPPIFPDPLPPQPPTDAEIDDPEQDTELEEVPDTQVEAVIGLIFGEDIDIPDSVKEIVTKAISEINKTEILDGLDEEYANKIRSEIIQDYLDGKLELEGITAEQIQEYINSEPSIKILLETAKALKSFESLIESGVITEEQIKTIIEENLVIQSDEEFEKMYIENGGEEAEAKNVNSFYDPETGKMYVQDTVDSKVITISIITIMGDIMVYDEETGEVLYDKTQGNLDKESDANISDQNTDTSTTPTEELEEGPETNLSGEDTDTSTSNDEVIGDKDVTVEMPEDDKNTSDTTTNVEDIPSNEDINIEDENNKEDSTTKTNLEDKQKQ